MQINYENELIISEIIRLSESYCIFDKYYNNVYCSMFI